MKTKLLLFNILLLLLFASCDKNESEVDLVGEGETTVENTDPPADLPEGFFEVRFFPSTFGEHTKAAVTGADGRVQHIRYMIYKSTGEFVKEKVVLIPSQGTPTWPLAVVKDTLPKGSYKAVFLGNVEKTLFPYNNGASTGLTADVLTNYTTTYSAARIVLPAKEFTDNSEYYWANVSFSDTNTTPSVLFQRIIGSLKLHRNFVDAQTALNQLVNNIVTQVGYRNIIQTTIQGLLPGLLRTALGPLGTAIGLLVSGGVDAILNPIVTALVAPITDALYNLLLQQLVNQIGTALTGNADQTGLLGFLGTALNPWANLEASSTVVTMNNFPKTIDFDLNVRDVYTGLQQFKYDFNTTVVSDQRYITIKGFNGVYDVRDINVLKQGLISGLVVDQVVDTYLLPGAFVDIKDPIQATGPKSNLRYQADYSFLDLGLKSYTQQTDGNHSLTLSVKIGNIANIDGILGGVPILGPVLSLILTPIKNITVSVPLNLPLLGVDNLSVSGSWSAITTY
ncbi:hypothetical protein [Dysgonomonas sp. ZJ279]|uniref:hypothetical protein n=1 Tax=Dysgonomonas sp. ZJ279 TaxID=2709796 RepID=UPI0013EAC8FD|nr:hypothetical protein [Dysgonomonas sp. ZJ279]